jgi:hypothetical protein
MSLKAQEVFVPGAYPQHTYITRKAEGLEDSLKDSLSTPGQVVSLSGPSKSGKTVLVERVVGRDLLIPISGASLQGPDDVWNRVLDWMDVPSSTKGGKSSEWGLGADIGIKGDIKRESTTEAVRERSGLTQVVHEIGGSEFVVLLDDFHYMNRNVQVEVAKTLKEGVRLGIKVVTAAVSHRGDDVVRANPELRGRVRAIDLRYWSHEELRQIADTGFDQLNGEIPSSLCDTFTGESAGSPQLMQLLCLQACFVLDLREKKLLRKRIAADEAALKRILEQTSSSTDFRSLVDVLDAGPRTRGTERKTYKFNEAEGEGDVYRVVLRALASSPPRLSFPYQELLERTVTICSGESPVGSSVTGTCLHMSKLAQEKFPAERAIDWDEQKQVFDVPDPYLLFYLRWSGRLREN